MAINPGATQYGAVNPLERGEPVAVVDVDINQICATNPLSISARALGVYILGGGSSGGGATADQIQGNTPSGTVDVGNPVKVGGFASATIPAAVTTGQRVNAWYTLNGQQVCTLTDTGGAFISNNTDNADGVGARANGLLGIHSSGYLFNGTTWDRQRKTNVYSRVASSAAAGNPAVLKASAGEVKQFWGINTTAAVVYLNIYNKATAPVLGTDTPIESYPIPASAQFSVMMPDSGDYFSTGISYAFSTDIATIPTTGTAAAAITSFVIKGA